MTQNKTPFVMDKRCLLYIEKSYRNFNLTDEYKALVEVLYLTADKGVHGWTADKAEATLFDDIEAEEIREKIKSTPKDYNSFIRVEKKPLTLDREPKYKMGEEVYVFRNEDRPMVYKGVITSITVDYVYPTFSLRPTAKEYHYRTNNFPFIYSIHESDDYHLRSKADLIKQGCQFTTKYGVEGIIDPTTCGDNFYRLSHAISFGLLEN